jgi:hypothetical protein
MTTYTAAELIAAAKAYISADAARMSRRPANMPRAGWRGLNPITLPDQFAVRDTAFKTRPQRVLMFDLNGSPYDLIVLSLGQRAGFIDRIDLRTADANEKLGRYERV